MGSNFAVGCRNATEEIEKNCDTFKQTFTFYDRKLICYFVIRK